MLLSFILKFQGFKLLKKKDVRTYFSSDVRPRFRVPFVFHSVNFNVSKDQVLKDETLQRKGFRLGKTILDFKHR